MIDVMQTCVKCVVREVVKEYGDGNLGRLLFGAQTRNIGVRIGGSR